MGKDKVDIELIKRYVRGELSPKEMYALERRAQDDPMLMDIILGLESASQDTHAANLTDIRKRIAEHTKQQRGVIRLAPFQRWALAASILVALTFGIRWFMQDVPEQTLPEIASIPPPAEEQKAVPYSAPESEEKEAASQDTPIQTPKAAATTEKDASPAPKRLALAEEQAIADTTAVPETLSSAPLSTAALRYKQDSAPQSPVDDSNQPEPEKGWQAYHRYLKQEAIHPEKLTGTVMLRFDIDDEGTPTNLEVVHTTDPSLDSQAIELVRKGPKWRLGKNGEQKAKVSVVFGNP